METDPIALAELSGLSTEELAEIAASAPQGVEVESVTICPFNAEGGGFLLGYIQSVSSGLTVAALRSVAVWLYHELRQIGCKRAEEASGEIAVDHVPLGTLDPEKLRALLSARLRQRQSNAEPDSRQQNEQDSPTDPG